MLGGILPLTWLYQLKPNVKVEQFLNVVWNYLPLPVPGIACFVSLYLTRFPYCFRR